MINRNLKISVMLCRIGFAFWIAESAFFCIRYGWHWGPVNDVELLCDKVGNIIIVAGFFYFFYALYLLVKLFSGSANITVSEKEVCTPGSADKIFRLVKLFSGTISITITDKEESAPDAGPQIITMPLTCHKTNQPCTHDCETPCVRF